MIQRIPPHVKCGGDSVMAWACVVSSGTDPLIFIDDVMENGCSRMNLKFTNQLCLAMYKEIPPTLSAGTSSYCKTVTQNTMPMQQKHSSLWNGKWKVLD